VKDRTSIPKHQPSKISSRSTASNYTSYYGRMELAQLEFQAKMKYQKKETAQSSSPAPNSAPLAPSSPSPSSTSSAPPSTTGGNSPAQRVANPREGYPIDWNREFQVPFHSFSSSFPNNSWCCVSFSFFVTSIFLQSLTDTRVSWKCRRLQRSSASQKIFA
jgi:hypothetical protein